MYGSRQGQSISDRVRAICFYGSYVSSLNFGTTTTIQEPEACYCTGVAVRISDMASKGRITKFPGNDCLNDRARNVFWNRLGNTICLLPGFQLFGKAGP